MNQRIAIFLVIVAAFTMHAQSSKVLVVLADYNYHGTTTALGPSTTPAGVANIMFNDPNGFSVAEAFREASYGSVQLWGDVHGPYHVTLTDQQVDENGQLRCGGYTNVANSARDMAVTAEGLNLASYERFVFVLPQISGCLQGGTRALGNTDIAGKTSWIFEGNPMTYEHELGHQYLGGLHCWTDPADPMNGFNATVRLFNGAGTLAMGWMAPSGVGNIVADGNYSIAPLELTRAQTSLIQTYRMTTPAGNNYVLSYRQPLDNSVDRNLGPDQNYLRVNAAGPTTGDQSRDLIVAIGPGASATVENVTLRNLSNSPSSLSFNVSGFTTGDFTIAASPTSRSIQQGASGTSTITTSGLNGFNSAVTLTGSSQPTGVSVSFSPNPIPAPGSGSSTATFTVSAGTAPGNYPITVTGSGGGVTHSTSVTLTVVVNAPPVASFTFNCTGLGCTFDGSGTTDDHGVVSYQWTFKTSSGTILGQQTTATPSTSFTFPADGNDYATLTASDGALTSTTSRALSVTSAPAAAPLSFFAVPPCRAFDSRSGSPLARGAVRNITIAGTVGVDDPGCGVPKSAAAVAVTATAISPDGDGWMNLYSDGHSLTAVALNFWSSTPSPRANNAIVRLTNGVMQAVPSMVTGTSTHLVVDVTGYYDSKNSIPQVPATGPYLYNAIPTACRIFDSRNPSSPLSPGVLRYAAARGIGCVAADAAALDVVVTVAGPTGGGDIRLLPSDTQGRPVVSSINFPANVQQSAGAQMRLGGRPSDDLEMLYDTVGSTNTTNVILDAYGYFGGAAANLSYVPIRPCRAFDTRDASGGYARMTTNVRQDFQIQGNCGVPRGAAAVFANVTAIGPDGGGFVTLWPSGAAKPVPPAALYNAGEPAIGNAVILPLSTAARDLSAQGFPGVHLTLDVFGYFIVAP